MVFHVICTSNIDHRSESCSLYIPAKQKLDFQHFSIVFSARPERRAGHGTITPTCRLKIITLTTRLAYRTASKAGVVPAQHGVAACRARQQISKQKPSVFPHKRRRDTSPLTLQRRVHAAHLVETCIPFAADDLRQDSDIFGTGHNMTDSFYLDPRTSARGPQATNHRRHLPESGHSGPRPSVGPQTWCQSRSHHRPPACSSGHQTETTRIDIDSGCNGR